MSGRRGVDLAPPKAAAPAMTAADAADRLGMTLDQFTAFVRQVLLEPTYSVDEVRLHFGFQGKDVVFELLALGRKYGAALHPTKGGLYPTFKPSHKSRRIPLSAIERHKRHMSRVHDGAASAA
jgi:hypothetical protein